MPEVVKELHRLKFDYSGGEGVDFEPFGDFLPETETRDWIRAWTGNPSLTGSEYRVFGQDGSGGYAAFWCVRPDASILDQPIVFLGSEGELGVVASDFSDYLWLVAGGLGPYEAVAFPDLARRPNSAFRRFAEAHAQTNSKSAGDVIAKAKVEFPDFKAHVQAQCSY